MAPGPREPLEVVRSWPEALASFLRLRRFVLVGLIGLLADMATIAVAVELLGLRPIVAKFLSAEAAIVVMFAVNEVWTFDRFGEASPRELGHRFLKSNGVRLFGVLIAAGVLYVLHDLAGVWYLGANAIGIGVGFVANYVLESLLTWRVQDG